MNFELMFDKNKKRMPVSGGKKEVPFLACWWINIKKYSLILFKGSEWLICRSEPQAYVRGDALHQIKAMKPISVKLRDFKSSVLTFSLNFYWNKKRKSIQQWIKAALAENSYKINQRRAIQCFFRIWMMDRVSLSSLLKEPFWVELKKKRAKAIL